MSDSIYHIIYNPGSHPTKSRAVLTEVCQILTEARAPFEVHETQYTAHAEDMARELTKEAVPVTFLIVGGDGTLNEVVNGLHYPSLTTIGLIPSGSGNDFARAMHLPKDVKKAMELILSGDSKKVFYGIVQTHRHRRRFMISCGAGYDSEVCKEVGLSRSKVLFNRLSFGNLIYGYIGIKNLLFRRCFSAEIREDELDKLHQDNITFITAFNTSHEGGGFCFCPVADPTKNTLHLLCVHDLKNHRIPLLFPLARAGHHLKFPEISLDPFHTLNLTFDRAVCIHTDGEVLGSSMQLKLHNSEDTIRMYLP